LKLDIFLKDNLEKAAQKMAQNLEAGKTLGENKEQLLKPKEMKSQLLIIILYKH
jgi:hypothetical protein